MEILKISNQQINDLIQTAKTSPRRRAHLNVHRTLDAQTQKLFIATEPDTYIRPHRHSQSHKWEFFTVLRGQIDLFIFDEHGKILQRVVMSPETTPSVEIPPNVWHTYVCQKPGTLAVEVKEGAFIPTTEENFAPWAPPENHENSNAYRESLRSAL